ncbi:MAG: hypothetical protein HC835_04360 [Oscillatoriales cyanobacterium RM2_1_1]|nr:hypothetical protein [Oscillatoriales cyanobacterium SM2_3_0]NJO44909.1 hypothetical protein [Oscillatoriales cyanobacterium RM2_1_1]
MKSALTLLTSLMVTGLVTPTLALSNGTRSNPIDPFSQGQGIIVADTWDDYRDRRHRELDQQINNEVNRPHNSRLSQKDKERIIKDAHRELDKRLDAEEKNGADVTPMTAIAIISAQIVVVMMTVAIIADTMTVMMTAVMTTVPMTGRFGNGIAILISTIPAIAAPMTTTVTI